jgi:putative ABC transport system permease protein
VNVTNLLLMRGAQRRGELAMRAALGAGRTRLVRLLLVEGLLLGVWGGAAGMLVAEVSVRALVALSPPNLPRLGAIHVAVPVLSFGAGITVLIGLAIGLIPALHVSRWNLHTGLQQGSRRSTGGHQATRRTLVVSEVALALMLLVGAGLLLRSFDRIFAVAPGFNPSNVLAMQVQVASARRFPDDAAFHRFYARALEAVWRVPGVTAAFTSQLPLGGVDATELFGVQIENDSNPPDDHVVLRAAVTPGYFELMGIPLIRGGIFEPRDMLPAAARPVLISQSFARRKFPGRNPIGQRVRIGGQPNRPWDVIAGVVGDVTQLSLAAGQTDTVYVATGQWLWADNPLWLVVRSPGDVATLAPTIKQAIWTIDKDQPIMQAATMERVVAHTAGERRFAMILFQAFALAALALAAIGIYGVLAGNVAERAREIGIRTALGATRADILALVLSQGLALAATGTAIGVGGAAAISRLLAGLLFGISHLDPATYGVVIALLLAVSAIASWIPAWRAVRIDPSITLRAE